MPSQWHSNSKDKHFHAPTALSIFLSCPNGAMHSFNPKTFNWKEIENFLVIHKMLYSNDNLWIGLSYALSFQFLEINPIMVWFFKWLCMCSLSRNLPSFLFLLDPNAQLATLHFLVSLWCLKTHISTLSNHGKSCRLLRICQCTYYLHKLSPQDLVCKSITR